MKYFLTKIKKSLRPIKKILILTLINIKQILYPPKTIDINNEIWKDKPLISIIIPCFNYGQFIKEAIDSVLKQTFQNFEIIIVNDGSTDKNTINILKSIKNDKIKIINQVNKKLPSARNTGIKVAQGKYICCLDADDKLESTYLEKCLTKMEHKNLDVCYSYLKEFGDRNEIWQAGDFDIKILMKGNCVTVAAIFKKSVWEKVGGFDETFTSGYEDWEFWVRVAKTGAIGDRVHEPLFLYRKHGHSMIDSARDKHNIIFQLIKNKNKDLYSNNSLVKKIQKSKNIIYKVKNKNINLLNV